MSLEYVPGEWTGLATGTGVVLLAPTVPSVTVQAVWDALAGGRPITQWLEIIAGGGISSLPAFALVERTPDGVRVLLRGDVVVDVDGTEVAARGMSTWREELVRATTDIVVRTPAAFGADGEAWPLLGGVVRAARIRMDLADAAPIASGASGAAVAASAEAAAAAEPMATEPATAAEPVRAEPAPEPPDDDSLASAQPVDVFEEAGFGPAGGGAEAADQGDEDEGASAEAPVSEPEGDDAPAEAPVSEPEGDDAPAEAPVPGPESDDAAAEAPVPGPDGDDASAEAPVPESEVASAEASVAEPVGGDASAEAPAPADGSDADPLEHETYVGPVPDIAAPGAIESGAPDGPEQHDPDRGVPEHDVPEHDVPEHGGPVPGGSAPEPPADENPEPEVPEPGISEPEVAEPEAPAAPEDPATDAPPPPTPVPPQPPAGTPTAEYEQVGPVSSGLIDSLPWNMPNAREADAAAQPPAPSPVPTFDPPSERDSAPPSSAGDAEIEGDHDGETILVSHLRTAYAQDAADAVPDQPPSATIVPGVADDALYDEPRPMIMLGVSSGPRVPLDRVVLIGRAPESSRFAGSLMPRLVTVPSPQQDISRTHVEVRLEGDHVVVTDLRSTNGTLVAVPGNDPRRLHPGEGVPVPVGSLIDLGDGITISVESAGRAHGQGH
ncbi:FHA domain-containing protein [Occultella glacieicola]|uniref:FHA domain-containing protein n=1 Tax=Occultella glacieicola TaxID=2518684 RepID=A0ABY2DZ45_9MICO|nr:FHA domain-containing protein [Occultella glacieicola]TDE89963.1 FHA domain-containing protein [Occultella glacieicola]